jgi:hypothetical protein
MKERMKRQGFNLNQSEIAWGFYILFFLGMYITIGLTSLSLWVKIGLWSLLSLLFGFFIDAYGHWGIIGDD